MEIVNRFILSYKTAKEQAKGHSVQRTSNFSTNVYPEIPLESTNEYNYFIYTDYFSSAYNWMNITEAYDNNKIRVQKPKTNVFEKDDFVFPDGMWTYDRIEEFLNQTFGSIKVGDKDVQPCEVTLDYAILKIQLTFRGGTRIDMRSGQFHKLLGFEPGIYPSDPSDVSNQIITGKYTPDITRSLDENKRDV